MKKTLFFILATALLIVACGKEAEVGDSEVAIKTEETVDGLDIAEVEFAKELAEDMSPVDITNQFEPTDTINISIQISGRPKNGIIVARFLYGDQLIAETSVDLADTNSSVIFSFGEDTFVGFNLTYDEAFPISPYYYVELYVDDQFVDDYEYQVIPPADAIPSIIDTVIFAKGIDDASEPVEPNNIFSPQDTIFLFGYGDIGNLSTLQAEWIVGDEVIIEDCSAFLTADQNYPDNQFYFSCALVDGWPTGTHSVLLTMDDIEIIDESFTIE